MNFIEILTGIKAWTNNKLSGKYEKPSVGIPKSDLASSVQSSLNNADSAYQKPSTGIPASDIADDVIPDVSQFITRTVNDLTNYYLKSETYTKDEVAALIGAIQQFHYEIHATLPETGANNVLYLIGPTGTGNDKYEEYVYAGNTWTKIGDTSIDLSDYVTTTALNTALANYTNTSDLNILLAGKQNTISDLTTIRSGAAAGATAYQKPNAGIPKTDMAESVQTSLGKADSAYQKPSGGVPKTDLSSGVQTSLGKADSAVQPSDIADFITRSVNDLTNYYLKSETYAKSEVEALIGAIQHFHYEVYPTLPATGAGNVLYLIGPTGTGSDRYEEYVYTNNVFTKIGDTSIDLSGYVTTQALNTALADYTTTSNLTQLLSQKENISNKTTSLSSESTDQQYPSAKAVYDFVMDNLGDIETLLAAI